MTDISGNNQDNLQPFKLPQNQREDSLHQKVEKLDNTSLFLNNAGKLRRRSMDLSRSNYNIHNRLFNEGN